MVAFFNFLLKFDSLTPFLRYIQAVFLLLSPAYFPPERLSLQVFAVSSYFQFQCLCLVLRIFSMTESFVK